MVWCRWRGQSPKPARGFIVRATGDTEGLSFGLENLAIAASDFHSLMLWGLGVGFSVLAWRKGLSAFTDIYPGFSDAAYSINEVSEAAQKELNDSLGDIEDAHDDAVEALEDLSDDVDDMKEQLGEDRIDIHHHSESLRQAVVQAEQGFEAYKAEQIAFHQVVTGKLPEGHDGVFFDKQWLLEQIPDIAIDTNIYARGFLEAHKAAQSRISLARKSAIETVHAAYKQFLNLPKG